MSVLKTWSDEAREAAAEARRRAAAHDKARGEATRANLYRGGEAGMTNLSADAMREHENASDHYREAAGHFDAGRMTEGNASMRQGEFFGNRGNYLSDRIRRR